MDKFGGSFQQTPLILAAGEVGDEVITSRLVAGASLASVVFPHSPSQKHPKKAGADLVARDEDGFIALHRAVMRQRLPVLNYFAELLRWKLQGKVSGGKLTKLLNDTVDI